jgi:hypothetical protein
MIDYIKRQIWKFIVESIRDGKNKEDGFLNKLNLEITKYDANPLLITQWYLEMELEGIIEIPNLIKVLDSRPCRMQINNGNIEIEIDGKIWEANKGNQSEIDKLPNIVYIGNNFSIGLNNLNVKSFRTTDYGLQWLKSDEKIN